MSHKKTASRTSSEFLQQQQQQHKQTTTTIQTTTSATLTHLLLHSEATKQALTLAGFIRVLPWP
jgi:hypothetical protein